MSLYDHQRIQQRLAAVADPVGFLINLFAHAPVGFAVWDTSGRGLLTNQAFTDLFRSEPPPSYNVLEDELLAANGMLQLFRRAFAGETVHVPTFWYDPRELKSLGVTDGRRVAISMTIFPLLKSNGELEYVAATYKDETELVLSSERLAESEERRRLALHAARAGTFEMDVQTGVNSWTPELEVLYGLEPGEFGRTLPSWEQLVHPDDRVAAAALFDEALGAEAPIEGQWRAVWRDGSEHSLFARFQVLRDEHGRPHRLIGVNVDITGRTVAEEARRRADLAIKESEARKAAILNSALDSIVSMDAAGRIVEVNAAAERMFGRSSREVVGSSLAETIIPAHLRNAHEGGLARHLREGTSTVLGRRVELTAQRRDGRTFPVEVSIARVEQAGPPTFTGFIRDITEAKQAQDDLLRSHARLRTLSEVSTVLATDVTDYQQLIDRIVRMTADLIGDGCMVNLLAPDGETFVNAASAHRDPTLEAEYRTYLAGVGVSRTTDTTVSAEVMRTGKPRLMSQIAPDALVESVDGFLAPLVRRLNVHSAVIVPIRSRDKVIGTISLQRSEAGRPYTEEDLTLLEDLAHRAGLAIENARLYAELDARVVERTAALETANRELETFSYSVAHDLRAPLRAMNGFSSILLEDHAAQLDDEGRAHLDVIRTSAVRMATLIDSLLSLARLSRTTVVRERVDLTAVAETVIEQLQRADPQRTVEVVIERGLAANGDLHLLRLLLENLLGNAWKFTSRLPAARIELGRKREGKLDTYFVRDNGAGFDMTYRGKLFLPFQRLHTSAEFEGTGIGLATVQRIVRQHGGRIEAIGEKGKGAMFSFTLDSPRGGSATWSPVR